MITITIAGRVGRDAETRHLSSGQSVTSVAVAADSGFGQNKKTTWFRCNIWGKQGDGLSPYLLKGMKVTISGEFSESVWTDNNGVEKKSCEINVDRVELGNKPQSQNQQGQQQPQQNNQRPAQQPQQGYQGKTAQNTNQQQQPTQQGSQPFEDEFEDDIQF